MEQTKREIKKIEDIQELVDSFYAKVRKDKLIGPIFNNTIGEEWPAHLTKMYTFWQTLLLKKQTYFGAPFPPHMPLPIYEEHFEVWMKLWNQTLDELFVGETAEEAKWRAMKLKDMFLKKLEFVRSYPYNY
ncbi:MAG TPA: group III truncated hemoglobin [Sphingobacterium sp.]|nr:group III truncated hemoglobin [Sphingobacterium sp.]